MSDPLTIFSDLVRLETELWNELDDRLLAATGGSMATYDAVRLVAATADCRVVDIATGLAITVGGASKLVDRVVEAGLAVRSSNPRDRRSSVVQLTPAGRAHLDQARAALAAALDELLVGQLSAADLAMLGDLLTRLRTGYARVAAGLRVAP
jgi:DNA-binding MarR family transcriptional regulator